MVVFQKLFIQVSNYLVVDTVKYFTVGNRSEMKNILQKREFQKAHIDASPFGYQFFILALQESLCDSSYYP